MLFSKPVQQRRKACLAVHVRVVGREGGELGRRRVPFRRGIDDNDVHRGERTPWLRCCVQLEQGNIPVAVTHPPREVVVVEMMPHGPVIPLC